MLGVWVRPKHGVNKTIEGIAKLCTYPVLSLICQQKGKRQKAKCVCDDPSCRPNQPTPPPPENESK